ncbi:Cysteine-rich receptor-like protein kinase 10 [Nymphaea thermarum]|nr:Cysteine-rich receptor-like protein kinase 10 [Nymphaea thermarum]
MRVSEEATNFDVNNLHPQSQIYEFSDLQTCLTDSAKRKQLDWGTRMKIVNGIARGLLYLHEDSRLNVIHRDLKASNILLDMEMNVNISDFGMAKLVRLDETHGNTSRIAGTYGYMSPEYAMRGLFSIKSDVFSFGVLLLEIVSGQKNASFGTSESSQNLLSHAWRLWRENRATEMVDRELVESCEMREAVRCIHVGLLCVQEDPVLRPTMSLIVLMLTSSFLTLALPSAPALCWDRSIMESDYSSDR